jgi:hypothetical protein
MGRKEEKERGGGKRRRKEEGDGEKEGVQAPAALIFLDRVPRPT